MILRRLQHLEAKRYSKAKALNNSNEFKVARIKNEFFELVPQPEVDATIEFLKLKML